MSIPPAAAFHVDMTSGDVLVVDDFRDTLALYDALLSEDGHRVRTAISGAEALAKVDEREPEIVLLDVSMPGMDGVEVLRRLKARRGGGPAVIMLTAARREPHAIESGLREGADAYLTKPIDSRELLARTRAALESFRLRRMLEAQRRDHIAMLVHDLRHPLSSLGLLAEVLAAEDLQVEERQSATQQMRTLCADMARLIDGVLAASRLEAGVFSVEPRVVTVAAVLDQTLKVFAPVATRRRVTLAFEGSREQLILADAGKLRQAFDNLVANALKFTPKGGRIRLAVELQREGEGPPGAGGGGEGKRRAQGHAHAPGNHTSEAGSHGRTMAVFEVSDNGPGIPAEEAATIFDRYRQGSYGRAAGGAGLGLAIARGIAEAHGGWVSVGTSTLGGACFRLAVPIP
ncbi:MAG TPA: hybrid sensor histidine kinase/response regulator [Polyangiaceae bacterium]